MDDSRSTRWASGANIVAGIWILLTPWILSFLGVGTATGNNIIVGVAIIVLAAVRYNGAEELWASWVKLILGVWMILSAYVLGFSMFGAILANNVVSGGVVAVLALVALSAPTVVAPTFRAMRRRGPTFSGTLPTEQELRRRREEELRHEEELRRIDDDRRGGG